MKLIKTKNFFYLIALLLINPVNAATFHISDANFTNLVGNKFAFRWKTRAVAGTKDITLDNVGDEEVFTYGYFGTRDFRIGFFDAIDNFDSFTSNFNVFSNQTVSSIGNPNARSQRGCGFICTFFDLNEDFGAKKEYVTIDFNNIVQRISFGNGGILGLQFLDTDKLFKDGYLDLQAKLILIKDELPSAVPVPAAVWLMGSGLFALMGIGRRREVNT